jgi:hypothetical protein
LLAVTGVAALLLGVHGWTGRHHGLPSAAGHRLGPASRPTAGPSAGPSAPAPGPKLSSQSYASYSFLVWPGTPSAGAHAAQTGLVVKVNRRGNGIAVTAGVSGQALPPATFYPTGAKVYIVEASMGDDSNNTDYNLGDDALIVTDAAGRILR